MPTQQFRRLVARTLCAGFIALHGTSAFAQEPRLAAAVGPLPLAAAATAAPEPAAPALHEWFGSMPWRQWESATGDWNTVRSWLNDRGFAMAVAETADVSSVRPAGAARSAVGRGLFDTLVTADSKLLHVPGSSALVELQWLPGGNGGARLGNLQGFSNIDADDVPLLGELWYEQRFGSRVRVKVGRVDANSEFAFVDAAADFLSPSMGVSPTILLPTYPTPSASASVFVEPVSHVEMGGGTFNGSPSDGRWTGWDSRFDIGHVGARWAFAGDNLPGRVTAGAWRLRTFAEPDADTSGLFVTAEQTFWTSQERNASAFVQVGHSHVDVPLNRHVGGGVSVRGLSRRRASDVTGVGATWVRLAPVEGDQPTELVIETFHRVVITPSISVIPDFQIVDNPGGDVTHGRSAAFTCRLQFDF